LYVFVFFALVLSYSFASRTMNEGYGHSQQDNGHIRP